MKDKKQDSGTNAGWTRRHFLGAGLTAGVCGLSGYWLFNGPLSRRDRATTFIEKVSSYSADLAGAIRSGLEALGVSRDEIRNKKILLKPNLVETYPNATHITTHPAVVRGAIEAFLALGADEVLIAEGPGHCRDSFLLLEESRLVEILEEDHIRFVDLNYDETYSISNAGGHSAFKTFIFPETLRNVDWIVSMPKMKTHHWAGVTLSMKNMFGVMPGSFYGWPKNVLHWAGINETILDIYATLQPHLAIVDGIVGMEGDGPVMGELRQVGVLVLGRSFPAVDATCARIMGINPNKINYLSMAEHRLGTIRERNIQQRGESIASVRSDFALVDHIPALRGIRL
ncbi:MAG: hypothetical protein H6Q52_1306 [Deltaproteobacteria bacterium]|jgi:uncharacterized protein (DUF362 family)|nr:hypothetical protein [Deltaproteobacteria bacterium]